VTQYDLSRPVLERLRQAADIVTVIGEHLTLKKQGRNWMGLCPFHGEKTPSFAVSREKGTYYCFGCKRGGDVIDFVMELDRLSFADAVERLAERFGVELPPASPAARRRREESELIVEALEAAQACFVKRLTDDRARTFLERRGMLLHEAVEFGLGYAPAEWRSLYDQLHPRIAERVLLASGLVGQGEQGRVWDRFRDRVTIPIRDGRGKLIAFGARAVGDEHPKYLNSPETALFSKGQVLFALDRAAGAFASAARAIVVEGYFDCMALHRAGHVETVATLGTALSDHHARELARRVPRAIVCFDGDVAGRQAARAALRTLLSAGLDVAVLLLPGGEDPDDVVRRRGSEEFGRLLAGALDPVSFLVGEVGGARDERRRQLLPLLEIVGACPDPARAFILKERLATAANLKLEELGVGHRRTLVSERAGEATLPPAGELAVLRYLLLDAPHERRMTLLSALPAAAFDHATTRAIVDRVQELLQTGGTLEISALTSDIEDRDTRRILAALEFEVPPVAEEHLEQVMRELWERERQRQLTALTRTIAAAEKQGDHERLAALLKEKSELLRRGTWSYRHT
jgi:DNA primase catalytic core